MIQEAIARLVEKKDLDFDQTKAVFAEIFAEEAFPVQVASFLTALKMKGETEVEISAAATVIREKANKVNIGLGPDQRPPDILDTCGTGGSGVNKFNISTVVSFVLAASGLKVAKHGNKAMSSGCGSADVLEELGIKIEARTEIMEKAIRELGIGFLYAPLYHPALRTVASIRKQMKIRTIFNILGPLCNPAFATHQLLGAYSRDLILPMAKVLKKLGLVRAFVVYGKDLKDEISLTGTTEVCFLNRGKIKNFTISPSSFGLKKIKLEAVASNSSKESAAIIREVLGGKKSPARDIVLANSAACFFLAEKVNNLKKGVAAAAEILDSKKAYGLLENFRQFIDKNA